MQPLTFLVETEAAGTRLDVFLAACLPEMSRARLRRLIEDENVTISGRVVAKPASKMRAGELIEIEFEESPPAGDLTPEEIPLDIVYEDDDLVVVNKPANLVVHPGAGVSGGTLANALAFYFAHLPARGGAQRPGIVHRLDRDTSGLIVVAKTEAAHENLSDQFRARTVFKSYVALVHGVVKIDSGRVEEPLGRDPRQRTRMAVIRRGAGGRAALTLYRVRRRFDRFTLLDAEIKTGRTHQIRVHLAHLKHPVVGDELYNAGRDRIIPDPALRARVAALGRQFLHAEQLAFDHPRTDERVRFTAPLPTELNELLHFLGDAPA